MVAPPHDNFRAARACFWLSALVLWSFAVIWGWRVYRRVAFPLNYINGTDQPPLIEPKVIEQQER
jgi:hypothetical protein